MERALGVQVPAVVRVRTFYAGRVCGLRSGNVLRLHGSAVVRDALRIIVGMDMGVVATRVLMNEHSGRRRGSGRQKDDQHRRRHLLKAGAAPPHRAAFYHGALAVVIRAPRSVAGLVLSTHDVGPYGARDPN